MSEVVRWFLGAPLAVGAVYILTMAFSGVLVRFVVGPSAHGSSAPPGGEGGGSPRFDIGAIIGKCENLLVLTFILMGAYTGLALIFTAKSIVRSDDIKKDPRYYLGGTLVNFTFSVVMAVLLQWLLGRV